MSKASGPDCIPVVVLKNCEPELSYILAELFNNCLKESCFADCWKVSSVAPVFKNVGERSTAKNTTLSVYFLWLVKSLKNLSLIGLLITWRNVAFFLISSMVLDVLNELQIFSQLYLMELLGLLHECGMLVFFTNWRLIKFLGRYLALFLLFLVIDGFKLFWMESLHKDIQLMLEFLQAPFLVLHFFCYTLMTLTMSSVILLSVMMILLSILSVIGHLICGNNLNWRLSFNLIYETLDWGKKWLVDFYVGKTQLFLFDWSNKNGSIDVKMDGSGLKEKSSSKMLGSIFSSKLDWGSYIISIPETACKKIGALIHSMKFLSPELVLYLYKSTIWPFLEYRCRIWAGAPSCYLELLDKLQKRICRTVHPSLAASLEPLAHCRIVASSSLFYRYYFGRCFSELA